MADESSPDDKPTEPTPEVLAVTNSTVCLDKRLTNVLVLGFSFMLIFTAFQTMAMAEESILESANLKGAGYTSLAIIYAVFAVSNFAAPSFVSILGPKWCMILSALLYGLFILSFIHPMSWTLYLGSVLVGLAAAVIWTAQGNFLTINSDATTIGRNSGLFWALLQCSLLWGNLYVYFAFRGTINITEHTRVTLAIVLSVVCGLGILLLFVLKTNITRDTERTNINEDPTAQTSRWTEGFLAFKQSLKLLASRRMILLSVFFAYTGLELTFFSGVYGTCVGHNYYFFEHAKSLIGLCGLCIGAGEIIGGASFGLMGSLTNRFGRDPIVLLGLIIQILCFYLIFLNLPATSPVVDNTTLPDDLPYIMSKSCLARVSSIFHERDNSSCMTVRISVVLLCAVLLGFSDACFNTQIYSLLGFIYQEDSAPAFALFKFTQSLAAAVGFSYSKYLLLPYQLLIMVVVGVLGSFGFFVVEWEATKMVQGYSQI